MLLKNVHKVLAGWKDNNDVRMPLMDNARNGDLFGILYVNQVMKIMLAVYALNNVLRISEMMDYIVLNQAHMDVVLDIHGNLVML